MKLPSTKKASLLAGSVAMLALATNLVGTFEGRQLQSYRDIVGVWTICYGETNGVHAGQHKTADECKSMLAKQLVVYEAGLDRCLTATVPAKMEIAFVSTTYNIGVGAACKSTFVRKANAGDLNGACDALLAWDKAGRRVIKGLHDRRVAERELCLQGVNGK